MQKRLIRWFIAISLIGLSLLALSGRWTDPWLWAYIALWAALGGYAMHSMDDDLARERFNPPSPGADRLSLRAIRLIALAHLIVGALDLGRWHLAPVPTWLRVLALPAMAWSAWLVFRAMRVNRFFSAVVRVQTDRGHRVVDSVP
jgi:hypothetical protein